MTPTSELGWLRGPAVRHLASVVGALAVITLAVTLTPARGHVLVLSLAAAAFAGSLAVTWMMDRVHERLDASPRTQQASPSVAGAAHDSVTESGVSVRDDTEVRTPTALAVRIFTRPKAGMSARDNEDSCSAEPDSGVASISDGASSSASAQEWAAALTRGFVTHCPAMTGDGLRTLLRDTAEAFHSRPADTGDTWWGEDAARAGAFATFLGLSVHRAGDSVAWEAAAVGDSVVLQLQSGPGGLHLVVGFPLESSGGFAAHPVLIGSAAAAEGRLPAIRIASGWSSVSDVWLLATDELAKWALHRSEVGRPLWSLLVDGTDAERDSAIELARISGEVANDDMTVMVVTIR